MSTPTLSSTFEHINACAGEISHDEVRAEILHLRPMSERPQNFAVSTPGSRTTNAIYDPHIVTISNLRALHDRPDINTDGFSLERTASQVRDFYDDAQVRAIYYPEISALLTRLTGASHVRIIEHVKRSSAGETSARQEKRKSRPPLYHAHVDYTPQSAGQAIQSEMTKMDEECVLLRARIINVWRPISAPVMEYPLALCDPRTLQPGDLVATDMVYPDKVWETYSLVHAPHHQWRYAPQMGADEVLLFSCFDSHHENHSGYVPHAAFRDPNTPANAAPRESIELRALILDIDRPSLTCRA